MARWHLLACDIGGTNSRFGHFVLEGTTPAGATLRLECRRQCATADIPVMEDAQAAARACFDGTTLHPDAQVWAAAGPLEGAQGDGCGLPEPLRAQLSNAALCVDVRALRAAGQRVRLINDFAAQAWACVSEAGRRARCLAPGETDVTAPDTNGAEVCGSAQLLQRAPLGVIGAGTGLGMASLVPLGEEGGWLAVPSEGGHAPFAFADGEEREYARFLRQTLHTDTPSAEQVLSGAGLERLHAYTSGERLPAAEISARYLSADATAQEGRTARLFARFYGRVCRQWILSTCCTGGLYVSGGVAAHNPSLVQSAAFMQEIRAADAPAWVRRVPLFLMDTPLSGLWGAARAAQALCAAAFRTTTV